ncbi:MAG: hypothetical protein ACT4PU_10305 [Planctomycetota bacterium]
MKALLLLAVLAAGLLVWDATLVRAEAAARRQSLRIAPLVAPETLASLNVAALRVQRGSGPTHLYGQKGGQWRCLTWRGALGDSERISELLAAVLGAEGLVQSPAPPRPQDYGLDGPEMLRLALHGPKASVLDPARDLLLSFDLGQSFGEGDGSFVRPTGGSEVWSIDSRPASLLQGDPPLLDRHLVPELWPGGFPRIQVMRVQRPGAPLLELELRAKPVSNEEMAAGRPPFEWVRRVGGLETPCAQLLAQNFSVWLLMQPWENLYEAALEPHLGFETPRAELVLQAAGQELRLLLGDRPPGGGPAVLNESFGLLYEVAPEDVPLIFPEAEVFDISAQVNPWQR